MIRRTTAGLLVSLLVGAFAAPALAAQAEPAVIGQAWYWEPQTNQEVATPVGNVSGQLSNPYCPGLPSSLGAPPETCAEGRLPVEVLQGDYETPDKVSALAFDLTMLTIGSEVQSFELELLEAESGCHPAETDTGQKCEETDSQNIEGKVVQVCEALEIFGDGEASQYKEMPKFSCDGTPLVGERKEIKNDAKTDPNDPDADFLWTFDLTPLAQQWAKKPPLCTCIMLRPQKPKNEEDDSPNWRVVFTGPKFEGGVVTTLKFTPGEGPTLPPPPPAPPSTGSTGSSGSSGSLGGTTTIGGGLEESSSDLGSGTGDTAAPSDSASSDDPLAAGETEQAADKVEVEAMPGYVWLAILAGLIGFSLVRSVVLESLTPQRANGVLAQIHRINAGRTGAAAAGATAEPATGLAAGLASVKRGLAPVGHGFSSLVGKVKGLRKG